MRNRALMLMVATAIAFSVTTGGASFAASEQPKQISAKKVTHKRAAPVEPGYASRPANSCDYDRAAGRCVIDLGYGRCMECSTGPAH